jgi:hypothetical protein
VSLAVETNVPYGNAGDVVVDESGAIAEVSFTAHPHGGPECCWFCFRIKATKNKRGKLRLVLKHLQNLLGARAPDKFRPVIRYAEAKNDSEQGWQRLPPGKPLVQPDGRVWASWEIARPASFVDVAFCYPYGRPEVEALIADSKEYWKSQTIGLSQSGRHLTRLANLYGKSTDAVKKTGVYLIARQHSGETSASWVLDGFMRYCAEQRVNDILIWCVPLANIDGVEQGDYGKDNFPWDINRAWGKPPMRHETLVFQRDVSLWQSQCNPTLAVDFHSPGACEDDGIYTFSSVPEKLDDASLALQVRWLGAARGALGAYASESFTRVVRYASRWETPTASQFFETIPGVSGIIFEVSYQSAGKQIFTIEHYQAAGRALAKGIIDELRRGRS